MPRRSTVRTPFSLLPTFDEETAELRAVIETPKESHNKYGYNPDLGGFELSAVLPEGMTFPYDFGFIPSTLGEDGDPVDILVLLDFPVTTGCIMCVRPIGVIEAKQKDKGKEWLRNDRLIGVASKSRIYEEIQSIGDLPPHLLKNIREFFADYNKLRDRKFKVIAERGPDTALTLVKTGMAKGSKAK